MELIHYFLIFCAVSCFAQVTLAGDCKDKIAAKDYRGTQNRTRGGLQCQRWDTTTPNKHRFSPKAYPDAGLDENFCRNPDGEPDGPWCYTTSKDKRWDYCYIPLCKPDKCKKTVAGQEYRGIVSQTKKGVECQRWDSKERVPRGITPNTHRQFGLDENFCRNPDGEPEGPWCYTTSPEKRWDYCDVPLCDPCSSVKCGFYSKCVKSDDGSAKCMCREGCPLIYKPICGSDGKTYPNQCVMEYEACKIKTMLEKKKDGECDDDRKGQIGTIVRPTVIEGKVLLSKSLGNDSYVEPESCLVIVMREAIYCTRLEDCPDTTVAKHVIKDIKVSPDNWIPYKLVVTSKLKPNRYLIEAVLNRGWCNDDDKDSKKWIKDGDFFNDVEHSIEIDRAATYNKDIAVRDYVEPKKELKKEEESKSKCEKERKKVENSFIVEEGAIQVRPGAFIPQCNEDGSYKEVQCHGSTGYCWCVDEDGTKRQETQVRFKKPVCGKDPCHDMKCEFYSRCVVSSNGNASCECRLGCPMIYKPVCGSNGKDYANKCVMEYESCSTKTIIEVTKQGKCNETGKGQIGTIVRPTVIEGKVLLSKSLGNDSYVEPKSCLVIVMRKAIYCTRLEDCPDTTVAKHVIKDIKVSPDNWIPYKLVVTSKLKPDRYLIEAVLNRGWCNDDDKDSKKWIKDGDFFNDVEHSIEIDRAATYNKDIAVRDYVEPKKELKKEEESKSKCEKERKKVENSFIVEEGAIQVRPGAFIPQCNEDGSYKEVQCHGSTGYCWCVDEDGTKRQETQVRFKKPVCGKDPCDDMKCEFYSRCVVSSNGNASCECRLGCPMIYKPVCGSNGKNYANKCVMEYESCSTKTIIEVKKQGKCNETETPAVGAISEPTIIEGLVVLGSEDDAPFNSLKDLSPEEKSKSCLVITLRDAIYCTRPNDCPETTVATHVIRNIKVSPDNWIPYKLVVESKLKPNRYLIEATLNRGWCYKDEEDGKKWLRDGDFFNDVEHAIDISGAGTYKKDIAVRGYKKKKIVVKEEEKKDKSECEKERQSVFESFPIIHGKRRPLLGAFMPQCNEDGTYKEVQCHGSTGYCWCVDEDGTKRQETEVRFKQPTCKKESNSKCEAERQGIFDSFPIIDGKRVPRLGAYIPQCNEDGSYKEVQCHEMFCWCADKNGTKVEGTEARFKKPKCGKESKSKCEKERQKVFDSFPVINGKKQPMPGAFIPQCNEDGSYKEVQCHGSTGYCWCVDEDGTKRQETEVRFKRPKC